MSAIGADSAGRVSEKPERGRRRRTGVRTLLLLIACCAAFFGAWRYAREHLDPVIAETRAIQDKAIDALKSDKAGDRLNAIHELERLQMEDATSAIAALAGRIDDPAAEVRAGAADALGSIASTEFSTPSGGPIVRASAAALIRGLEDSDPAVRVAAVRGLGLIASRCTGPRARTFQETLRPAALALIDHMRDSDPRVKSAMVPALGEFAGAGIARNDVDGAFRELFHDRDVAVRLSAITALTRPRQMPAMPTVLLEAVKNPSADLRKAVISGLNSSTRGFDPWVRVLLELAENDPDSAVRDECIRTLARVRPPAITPAVVPNLVGALRNSREPKLRDRAIAILGSLGPNARAAIPDLLSVLAEPVEPVDLGSTAATALGRIGPGSTAEKTIVTRLTEIVRSGPERQRGAAARALGEFGSAAEDSVPALIDLLREAMPDDTYYRAWSAAAALGRLAPSTPSADDAVTALRAALDADSPELRTSAIQALSFFGDKAAAAVLRIRALREDRDPSVRNAAAAALRVLE